MTFDKETAFDLIRSNIASHGHHVYVVAGDGPLPRFAYTIGVRDRIGVELVLAGASIFQANEVTRIINHVACKLQIDEAQWDRCYDLGSLGLFSLRPTDPSWTSGLMLGALDYYRETSLRALQIVPDDLHLTIDTPDLGRYWSASEQPVWQWLYAPWNLDVPPTSKAITNINALRGKRVTEAARWEVDQWELFSGAGPDIPPDEGRVMPLGTLLAVDETLMVVTRLDVGRAIWRDSERGEWHAWN
jgi:hypothetical protein